MSAKLRPRNKTSIRQNVHEGRSERSDTDTSPEKRPPPSPYASAGHGKEPAQVNANSALPTERAIPVAETAAPDYGKNIDAPSLYGNAASEKEQQETQQKVAERQKLLYELQSMDEAKRKALTDIFHLLDQIDNIREENSISSEEISKHRIFNKFKSSAKNSEKQKNLDPIIEEILTKNKEKWGSLHRNPVAFLKRVYCEELEGGVLKRNMLVHLDFALAQAYASWIRPKRHPEDSLWPDVDGKGHISPTPEEVEERAERIRKRNARNQRNYAARLSH